MYKDANEIHLTVEEALLLQEKLAGMIASVLGGRCFAATSFPAVGTDWVDNDYPSKITFIVCKHPDRAGRFAGNGA